MSFKVGGSSGSQNQTTEIPDWLKGDWENLNTQAQDVYKQNVDRINAGTAAYDPTQRVAPASADQNAGWAATRNAVLSGAGIPSVNKASDVAAQIAGGQASPMQVNTDPTTTAKVYNPDSAILGDPKFDRSAVQNASGGQVGGTDLTNRYLNPYTDNVVDRSLQDIDLQRQRAINGNTADYAAKGRGALTGSRAGVNDALTNEAFAKTSADTSAKLRQAGYDTATGLQTSDLQRQLQAQLANQNVDTTAQQANQQEGLQTGLAKYSTQADALKANAAAANTASQSDADRALQASLANQSAKAGDQALRLQAANSLVPIAAAQQQMPLQAADALTASGSQQQALAQQQKDATYQEFLRQLGLPADALNALALPFGVQPSTGAGSSTQQSSNSRSKGGGI